MDLRQIGDTAVSVEDVDRAIAQGQISSRAHPPVEPALPLSVHGVRSDVNRDVGE